MRTAALALTCLLAGCGSPNFYPQMQMTLAAPTRADDASTVDMAATAIGFRRLVQPPVRTEIGQNPAIVLASWEWSSRKSTRIDLAQLSNDGTYYIVFYDNGIHGFNLIGTPCRKYLEFTSQLRERLGSEQRRLTLSKVECNPDGLDYSGNPYRD